MFVIDNGFVVEVSDEPIDAAVIAMIINSRFIVEVFVAINDNYFPVFFGAFAVFVGVVNFIF